MARGWRLCDTKSFYMARQICARSWPVRAPPTPSVLGAFVCVCACGYIRIFYMYVLILYARVVLVVLFVCRMDVMMICSSAWLVAGVHECTFRYDVCLGAFGAYVLYECVRRTNSHTHTQTDARKVTIPMLDMMLSFSFTHTHAHALSRIYIHTLSHTHARTHSMACRMLMSLLLLPPQRSKYIIRPRRVCTHPLTLPFDGSGNWLTTRPPAKPARRRRCRCRRHRRRRRRRRRHPVECQQPVGSCVHKFMLIFV